MINFELRIFIHFPHYIFMLFSMYSAIKHKSSAWQHISGNAALRRLRKDNDASSRPLLVCRETLSKKKQSYP